VAPARNGQPRPHWQCCKANRHTTPTSPSLSPRRPVAAAPPETTTLNVKLALPPYQTTPDNLIKAGASVVLTAVSSGQTHRAYALADGSVTLTSLEEGSYLLDVVALGFLFPQFRVDVAPRFDDSVTVSKVANRMPLPRPFVLQPYGEARYYQERKPFDIKGLLMSPYGIMIGAPRCNS
jgi:hypothetical protein